MSENVEELEQSEEEVQQTEAEIAEQAEYDKVYYGDDEAAEEEVKEEEEPEPKEEEPEVETEGEEQTEEDPEGEEEEPEEEPKDVKLLWRGKEIFVTKSESIAMAQQGFDATHKYQEVADLRKRTQSDLDLIERARKGDKKAIAQIIKEGEVDPVDLLDMDDYEEDTEQGALNQDEPFVSPQVANMLEEVSRDEQLYNNLRETEKDLPQVVIDKMAKDPETFYAIVNEVRSGDANIVMPEVHKEISKLNGLDRSVVMGDIDAFATLYTNVKNSMIQASQKQVPESKPTQKQKRNPNELSIKKSGGTQRKSAKEADPFSDDKAYQAVLARLEANGR